MAGEIEENLDTDYSGRPFRPETGIVMGLPDGRRVILGGGDSPIGEWFVLGEDGPDWDQPVDIRKELNQRPPGRSP